VISGRDRKDLTSKKVEITSLIYAGSHGFDIAGPNDLKMQYEPGKNTLPVLDQAKKKLKERLRDVEGVKIERKKYAIEVHFRNSPESKIGEIDKAVYEVIDQEEKLKIGTGKKILELKPDLDWNKGRALNWIMETLELNHRKYLPVFIGDDITDEDAFDAVRRAGIGIIVGSHGHKTAASFRLEHPEEVFVFLERLSDRLRNGTPE
jgi:trehalose 6-phosphate phosphatase